MTILDDLTFYLDNSVRPREYLFVILWDTMDLSIFRNDKIAKTTLKGGSVLKRENLAVRIPVRRPQS